MKVFIICKRMDDFEWAITLRYWKSFVIFKWRDLKGKFWLDSGCFCTKSSKVFGFTSKRFLSFFKLFSTDKAKGTCYSWYLSRFIIFTNVFLLKKANVCSFFFTFSYAEPFYNHIHQNLFIPSLNIITFGKYKSLPTLKCLLQTFI